MKIFQCYLMSMCLTTLCLALNSCGNESDDLNPSEALIRGYWICYQDNLALEIISTDDYLKEDSENYSSKDNVYQLWYIGEPTPKLYVGWNYQTKDYFHFFNPDYSWSDFVKINNADLENLILSGTNTYHFIRTTKNHFDSIVNRDSGNNSNSGVTNESLTLAQVKNRTNIKITYNKYRYNITATYSPINGENASFDWAVSRRGAEIGYKFNRKDIISSTKTVDGNKVFTIEFPFYIYFAIRAEDPNEYYKQWGDKCFTAEDYLASYDILTSQQAAGEKLSSEELQLLQRCVDILDKLSSEVRYDFSIWIYAIINNEIFNLGEKSL